MSSDSSSLSVPPCSSLLSTSLLDSFRHRARNNFGPISAEEKTLEKIMPAQSNQGIYRVIKKWLDLFSLFYLKKRMYIFFKDFH